MWPCHHLVRFRAVLTPRNMNTKLASNTVSKNYSEGTTECWFRWLQNKTSNMLDTQNDGCRFSPFLIGQDSNLHFRIKAKIILFHEICLTGSDFWRRSEIGFKRTLQNKSKLFYFMKFVWPVPTFKKGPDPDSKSLYIIKANYFI